MKKQKSLKLTMIKLMSSAKFAKALPSVKKIESKKFKKERYKDGYLQQDSEGE